MLGMSNMGKSLASILILIMAISSLSLSMIKPADAVTIVKPSIPQFTLSNNGTSVKITIQDQPLVLTLSNESLYYNVRVKEHQGDTWTELYSLLSDDLSSVGTIILQSNSGFTEIIYSVSGYPENTLLDFQVIAMYGYYYTTAPVQHTMIVIPGHTQFAVLADGESGYSSTQTIVVNSTTPSSTPTIPEFPFIAIPLLLSLLSVAIILTKRKRRICTKHA
jgi:hypothetical protein